MTRHEIAAVAALEADRHYGDGEGHASIAERAVDGKQIIGLARRSAYNGMLALLKSAGLKTIAVDHALLCLRAGFSASRSNF